MSEGGRETENIPACAKKTGLNGSAAEEERLSSFGEREELKSLLPLLLLLVLATRERTYIALPIKGSRHRCDARVMVLYERGSIVEWLNAQLLGKEEEEEEERRRNSLLVAQL